MNHKKRLSIIHKLNCISDKCDRILAELIILRHKADGRLFIDDVIDRLHTSARRMRQMCEAERAAIESVYGD